MAADQSQQKTEKLEGDIEIADTQAAVKPAPGAKAASGSAIGVEPTASESIIHGSSHVGISRAGLSNAILIRSIEQLARIIHGAA